MSVATNSLGATPKVATIVARLRSDVNKLKRSEETKMVEHYSATYPLSAAAQTMSIDNPIFLGHIDQGTASYQRIGAAVRLKRYQLGLTFKPQSSPNGVAEVNYCHVWVVLDKQCNGVTASATDIWANSATAPPRGFRNNDTMQRFTILQHILVKVLPNADGVSSQGGVGTADAAVFQTRDYDRKLDLKIPYDATGGLTGDLTKYNLMVWYQGETALGAPSEMEVKASGRLYFTDS